MQLVLSAGLAALVCAAPAAEGGEPTAGAKPDVVAAKETPKPPPKGAISLTVGKPPKPAESEGLLPRLPESSRTCVMAAMIIQREQGSLEDPEAGRKKAAEAVVAIKKVQTEMARDKYFAKLPSALAPELSGKSGNPCHYFLYVPEDYDPSRKYPVLLFLHGAGGNLRICFYTVMRCAKEHKFIAVAPTYKDGQFWTKQGSQFALKTLEKVRERYSIDPKRVVVGGISNGAVGAWAISEAHRDKFSGVISLSGAFAGGRPLKFTKGPPLYITHGGRDGVIPVGLSRAAFKVLKARKGTVYRELPQGGHLVTFFQPEKTLGAALKWFEKLTAPPKPQETKTGAAPPTVNPGATAVKTTGG
jgi:predicted esterase